MDADEVACSMCDMGDMIGMPADPDEMMAKMMAGMRDNFNNANREQADDNVDAVAKFYYQTDEAMTYYLGLARKNRSASYQERYLWMPMESTAGLADGNKYLGNIELDPEVSHEIELGFDLQQNALSIAPRIFYKDVDDYIQGTPEGSMSADLKFNNVDAKFYGFDVETSYRLNGNWSVSAIVNYVRGERKDISDNLYRIAPLNGIVAVEYQGQQWQAVVETVLVAEQDKVSETNNETETGGYGLVNLKARYQLNSDARLSFGVDNIFDKVYRDHLGGINRVSGSDVAVGERLPGYGQNVFARIDYAF
jgi:iron complex outermembrane receptor protein